MGVFRKKPEATYEVRCRDGRRLTVYRDVREYLGAEYGSWLVRAGANVGPMGVGGAAEAGADRHPGYTVGGPVEDLVIQLRAIYELYHTHPCENEVTLRQETLSALSYHRKYMMIRALSEAPHLYALARREVLEWLEKAL